MQKGEFLSSDDDDNDEDKDDKGDHGEGIVNACHVKGTVPQNNCKPKSGHNVIDLRNKGDFFWVHETVFP